MKKLLVVGICITVAALLVPGPAGAAPKIKGETVEYTADGVTLKGYLAYDEHVKGKRPGVLVVHEWWGLNDYARKRARMLAELGYTALAVDMYGNGKTATHPDDAGKFSSETMKNFDAAKARFLAAEDFLKKQPTVDPERIAAIGYCFGGGVVLNMARQGDDLKGVASFHGSLMAVRPAGPGEIKAKIRVYTGADDKFVPAEAIEGFKKEMTDANADVKIVSYPGAVHSFTNPDATALGKKFNLPLAYNATADKESWEDMKKFLSDIFKK
ncbi:MAG TPA: dienelactone hydrolase family protein [Nitrospirota bacterium]|nr:dienelactone hydrolase family protein [Nitrospirota bacterium]